MRTTKSTLSTSLDLPIEITYTVLPAEHGIPEQADITSVTIDVKGSSGKRRQIELLSSLTESEVLLLEDMVLDSI
jgi:hypothetical protein